MQTSPVFRDATPTVTWTMRFFVGANIAVILYCAVFLVRHFAASGLGSPAILATALAGYFLADFSSGVGRWGLDTWFDERAVGRAIAIAREHHTHPHHIHGYGFLDYASLGSTPSALVFGLAVLVTVLFPLSAATYALMIVWFVNSTCQRLATSFHTLAHRPPRPALVPLPQRLLPDSPPRPP